MYGLINRVSRTVRSGQFVRFAAVGFFNTVIDFAILNGLISFADWQRIPANVVSATTALSLSFLINSQAVFPGGSRSRSHQVVLFFSVTLFGLYVIQNMIIYILTEVWTWPLDLFSDIVPISRDVIYTNVSKLAASAVTLVWNFALYKKLVFTQHERPAA